MFCCINVIVKLLTLQFISCVKNGRSGTSEAHHIPKFPVRVCRNLCCL